MLLQRACKYAVIDRHSQEGLEFFDTNLVYNFM